MNLHLSTLIVILIVLIGISVFFSLAETALLSVNRYRIRHLARQQIAAKWIHKLLERPDRMLGVILLGDTCADIFASAVATLIAIHVIGDKGVFVASLIMTFVVLIFGEVAPKTLAAIFPEKIAFIAVWPLLILLRILYPLVWIINIFANGMLRLLGVKVRTRHIEQLSREELGIILHEASGRIPLDYRSMLIKILDLGKATVEDIMVLRSEIVGIDLAENWEKILDQLKNSQHTRLPIYEESIDQVVGILHVRKALNLLAENKLDKASLREAAEDSYFVLENTPLNVQLLNFRRTKNRSGLVVNEYGDILGLVTLEDILEEIVGEFTTDVAAVTTRAVHPQPDGSYLVDGSTTIRELNRALQANFSTKGPKTLSGLLIEYLEMIPPAGIALLLQGYPIEILQVKDNKIKTARIFPKKTAVIPSDR